MKVVYCTVDAVVHVDRLPVRLAKGQPRWENEPVVKRHPSFFVTVPPRPDYPPVEQATAAPGEVRNRRA